MSRELKPESGYDAWLRYSALHDDSLCARYRSWATRIVATDLSSSVVESATEELRRGLGSMLGIEPATTTGTPSSGSVAIVLNKNGDAVDGEYAISTTGEAVTIETSTPSGALYGAFHLLRLVQMGEVDSQLPLSEKPTNKLRMVNHWDNGDGSIERGYAGRSIYYEDGSIKKDLSRVTDYARILASVGINAVSINNVNAGVREARFITPERLPDVERIAALFRRYGIRTFVSIDYSSPISLGGMDTADPLDPGVAAFWKKQAEDIYKVIPDFGGFVVKADSENRPGPHTYGRTHAEGANVLGRALKPFGGLVVWRCFVYNCHQDWRDRTTDRARAAYDTFKPLDGQFMDNVMLQIKNGPVDFQVREPVSPLIGGLEKTNLVLEFQITQEYTGQQRHVCYLVPQWKEVLEFETYATGAAREAEVDTQPVASPVRSVVAGDVFPMQASGIAGVVNVGDDDNWTGHHLAQANLYGFGRLTWNPALEADAITNEWVRLTFGNDEEVVSTITSILDGSWLTFERYTAPLGVGWMCNTGYHYGPSPDGYEYSMWGTYHFADCTGVGVDRTVASGTGYSSQYRSPNAEMYESLEECPDELILFFHHVPYSHRLKNGSTVIQHIYETHFTGVDEANSMRDKWRSLEGRVDPRRFDEVLTRMDHQVENAELWRDVINTYFYRKSGVPDEKGRRLYP